MNEEQIQAIVERAMAAQTPDDCDVDIVEGISAVLGEGAGDAVRGVVIDVLAREEGNAQPHSPIIGPDEELHEVDPWWGRRIRDEFLRAITQAIMTRLQGAGFHVDPFEE